MKALLFVLLVGCTGGDVWCGKLERPCSSTDAGVDVDGGAQ